MLADRKIKRYGYIPDLPDQRDHYYSVPKAIPLPPRVDMRPNCPAPYDQGELGSCTANAIAGAIEFDLMKQVQPVFTPSRLFIYYNERVMEHSVNQDAGAMIRDGIKSVNEKGVCRETLWPYDITKFTQKPNLSAFTDAKLHQALSYARIKRTLQQYKTVLASGFPFVFGFSVYESFESPEVAATGEAPYPRQNEQMLGGHAVLAVGYDDDLQRFICRNSWGPDWGDKGYFTLPYQYLTNGDLAEDFWCIKVME